MTRMVQTAADIIATEFQELVSAWPSLDQSPLFDVAMIDACVGCDDYRKNLATSNGLRNRCNASPPRTPRKLFALAERI